MLFGIVEFYLIIQSILSKRDVHIKERLLLIIGYHRINNPSNQYLKNYIEQGHGLTNGTKDIAMKV